MLSPGHLMCTWLRGGSQVGAFAAACEPEGKRAHWAWAIPEGLWVERWDSYHGAAYHCFQALACTLPGLLCLAKVTRKTTRASDPEASPGLLTYGMRTLRTGTWGSPLPPDLSTCHQPYLISSVLLISTIISGQLVAAKGAGVCLRKGGQCSGPGQVFITYHLSPAPSSHLYPSPFSDPVKVHKQKEA